MSTHDDFQQEPVPPAPKSSGSKVLLILGTIFGLGLVVCCGGGTLGYFWLRAKIGDSFSLTTNADEVKAKSKEVAEIELPEDYKPISAMHLAPGVFTMKMIMYQVGPNNQGAFILMEMDQPGADPKQMREQMLQQMRSQQSGAGGMNHTQIVPQSTETKMFEINGENVEFDFVKGTRPGDPTVFRQVTGTFAGRQGTVLLMLIVPDSEYNEEAVKKLITSIRVPGKIAGSDAPVGTGPTEMVEEEEPEMQETEGKDTPAGEQTPEAEAVPEKTE